MQAVLTGFPSNPCPPTSQWAQLTGTGSAVPTPKPGLVWLQGVCVCVCGGGGGRQELLSTTTPSNGFCGMLVWAEMASGVSANASHAHAVGTSQRTKGELLEEGHLPTSLVPRSVDADLRACLLLRFPCFIPVCPLKNKNGSVSPEETRWPHSAHRASWELGQRPNLTRPWL